MIAKRRREFIGASGVKSSTGMVLVLAMFLGKVAGMNEQTSVDLITKAL